MMAPEVYTRTDLAAEWPMPEGQQGYRYTEQRRGFASLSVLAILDEAGAAAFQRPVGQYVTLSFPPVWQLDGTERKQLTALAAKELHRLCVGAAPGYRQVLAVGLGNRAVTADAIGPLCTDRILVTRCPDGEAAEQASCPAVSAVAPGVSGQTGIETAELILGAVRAVKPQLVICIDALAARSTERLAGTIQLCDAGISPGSGVKNDRRAIDAALLGVPVIAVGVPTVVDSATLVYDALEEAGIGSLSPALTAVLENGRSFFVSPKETDLVTEALSGILADAVNLALAFPVQG